ncbi:MAG: TonB family protein [Nitrospirota bacterium]|nr:TonB family protein [Nitrospirota bacterium]
MTLKKFLLFSVLAHAIILYGVYFVPVATEKQQDGITAMLVSPGEIPWAEERPPETKEGPVHPIPPAKKINRSKKLFSRVNPRPDLSAEKPVVPGEGKDTGRPLPENVYPETGGGKNKDAAGRPSELPKPGFLGREGLFDTDVIGDIAKNDTGGFDGTAKSANAITFDTKKYRYAGYMKKLKTKIESIWVYPPEARIRGIYGDLKIRFVIKKNGRLGAVELVRTSGYKALDDAAIKALKEGEPYWPLPDAWGMESYAILGHFIYDNYGYSLR